MPGATTHEPRITVIDDSTEMLSVMSEILESVGCRVATLSGDHVTLDQLAATEPDLIVIDLVLGPNGLMLNGWEYLSMIRSHSSMRAVPILVCSGDIVQLRARSEELNADPETSVLQKPFGVDELKRTVTGLVGRSGQVSRHEQRGAD